MSLVLIVSLSAMGLFWGMLLFSEIGRRMGIAKLHKEPEDLGKGTGAAEAAVFGLLGLLIAFTFSGAASRFEDRRHLITTEANAIGTAYLRIDLLPGDSQPELRELFRRYVDARSVTFLNREDHEATKAKLDEGAALQREIWTKALAACRRQEAPPQATLLLLPSLNEMIDITTTREMATQNHPPLVIFLMLGLTSLIGSLLIGFDSSPNKHRSWLHVIVFAATMSIALYVIADLEYPRLGLIRIDAADQMLIELRKSMQ